MTEHEINELKFIWAYMITQGRLTTNGQFSYYGGGFDCPLGWGEVEKHREMIKKLVKEHGVAWEATGVPEYRVYAEFSSTDHPSNEVETLCGNLVLTNGSIFKLGAKDVSKDVLDAVQYFGSEYKRPDYVKEVFG